MKKPSSNKLWIAMSCLSTIVALAPLFAAASAAKGKEVFENNCSICHDPDSTEKKIGPGLKGLFKKPALTNKKKPTDANVTAVINDGGNGMPGFGDQLTPAEKLDLLAFLKTL
jgi:cytochrome c